jgi:hypothetical protein
MTDPRLHSTEPIDDEVPFEDAADVARDDASEDEDAIVTPAATERNRLERDRDVERTTSESEVPTSEPGGTS